MSEVSSRVGLQCQQQVLPRFASPSGYLPRHFGGVIPIKGERIEKEPKTRVQALSMRLSSQGCSVLVSVQQQVCVHKKSIAHGGRSKTHGLLIFSETRFILPESVIENTEAVSEADLAWEDLFAKGIALPCLHEVASHNIVIISFDDQLLPLTHTCAQFEGLPDVFHGQCSTYHLILAAHRVVSRGEIRVQLDCTLKKSNRRNVARELCLNTQTEGLQCFKRWCCRLLERCVVFLYGAQGFPESPSHFQGDFPKYIENVAFVARLRFRARQQLSINTVHGFQNQVVAGANQSNRTV